MRVHRNERGQAVQIDDDMHGPGLARIEINAERQCVDVIDADGEVVARIFESSEGGVRIQVERDDLVNEYEARTKELMRR